MELVNQSISLGVDKTKKFWFKVVPEKDCHMEKEWCSLLPVKSGVQILLRSCKSSHFITTEPVADGGETSELLENLENF